jgi:chemotaxis protein histidine kinase CheA
MMQIAPLAELAPGTEVMVRGRPGVSVLLLRILDQLSGMVEALARGEDPSPDRELLDALLAGFEDPEVAAPEEDGAEPPVALPSDFVVRAEERRAGPGGPAKEGGTAAAAPAPRPALAPHDVRVDAASLDAVAERATQVRIMALAGRQSVTRMHELARLAEEGLREPQPAQVLAVVATMLRRTANELEAGQRRLVRSAEEQLETMLSLQLQPLRAFLRSVSRYAREIAASLGKEVEVELEGEETRLDRRIARELEEALLHLVRNAVDHGLEGPEERVRRGKPRCGRLSIRALGDEAKVRLVVEDDGAGIDLDAVRERALAAGLVDPAALGRMADADVRRLLFVPGFTTKRQVSEVSGRGVGPDIVAAAAARVGGQVFSTAASATVRP